MAGAEAYVVYAAYGPDHVDDGLALLGDLCHRVLPRSAWRVVVVQNAWAGDVEVTRACGVHVISGDNSSREFSAYDRGVWWLRSYYDPKSEAVFLIANDTFHRSYGREYLELFTPEKVQGPLQEGRLVGWVDSYPEAVSLFGLSVRCWVRTSLVFCRLQELERLLPLALPFEDREVFSGDCQSFFCTPSPLSENYRRYLRAWLFGEPDGSGEFRERWHGAAALTPSTMRMFLGKARAILCEHYLSAKAGGLGIGICDVRRP